jgi:FtsP/CotA-like multicopper oxidase with cupredoxin domain
MKRNIAAFFVLSNVFAAALWAQAQVRPFQPPPRLQENRPPAGAKKLYAFAAAGAPQTCDPQGSVVRDGSITSVSLDYVLANFTMFNPNADYSQDPIDPKDPSKGGIDHVRLRSFGGCPTGPLIEVAPGTTLRMDLKNQLDKNDPSCLANPPAGLSLPPGVGCFNTMNLHTHGLHVSPTGNSDNVLLSIGPQTRLPYEINIPSDHPSGTFWYHAHRHGSTAVQVASGASGVLVVRGDRPYTPPTPDNPHPVADIDTILHDTNGVPMPEQLFILQQIAYGCFQNNPLPGGPWQQIFTTQGLYTVNSGVGTNPAAPASAPWKCPKPTIGNYASDGVIENFALQLDSPTIWDTNGRFTSVNGVVQPTITLPAGQIQRWRFVHSGIHDTVNLQVVRAGVRAPAKLIALSALSGDRQEQKDQLLQNCDAKDLLPQFEIAVDGLTRTHMHALRGTADPGSLGSNYLQPGYRSDVLIVFPQDGDYCLLDQAAPKSERPQNGGGGGQGPSIPQLLAYLHVVGGTPIAQGTDLETYVDKYLYDGNKQLPEPVRKGLLSGDLTPWAPFTELPAPTPGHVQQAGFNITTDNQGVYFQVNGLSYNPDIVNITRQVNTVDDWILSANGEPHIFHIHVNPFEIMDVTYTAKDQTQQSIFDANGNCKPEVITSKLGIQYCRLFHAFRDTVFVEDNYQVHIRTYYDRYIGEFVLHCHILDHEDGGMMLNINIVPDISAPGGGLGMAGMRR